MRVRLATIGLLLGVHQGCAPEAPGSRASPRGDARVSVDASLPGPRDVGPPEPWQERPRSPAVFRPAPRPAHLRQVFRGRRYRRPPLPRIPPKKLWPRLLALERLWAAGRRSSARSAAARLARDPALGQRYLAATVWSCPPCALDAVARLRRHLHRATWRWSEARWLLPLCGHPDASVRAAALAAFTDAATRLEVGALRRRLASHLPVFRPLVGDSSPWVRAEAVALLGVLRDRTSYRLLSSALGDPRPVVRVEAVRAMARAVTLVPGASTTQAVCQRLADASPTVRAVTLEAVGRAPGACPLADVATRLGDRWRARLRLLSHTHGDGGLRLSLGEVRESAWRALPPALRPSAPGLPWDLRIADARRQAARAGLRGEAPSAARIHPRAPALPSPSASVARSGALRALLDGPSAPAALRARLAASGARALLGVWLPGLGPRARRRALAACRDRPLSGPLLSGVVALLAHPSAESRWQALGVLRRGTLEDARRPVLERALWLARRDPHPLVRRRALGLLVRWHAGAAVRARVRRALRDPHPGVRLAAVQAMYQLQPRRAAALLAPRLGREVPLVRAALLHGWIRDRRRPPPVDQVIRALGDASPARLRVRIGARVEPIDPGFSTVRSAVLMALEATYGTRHRGRDAHRAARWQDDLRRHGWSFPP